MAGKRGRPTKAEQEARRSGSRKAANGELNDALIAAMKKHSLDVHAARDAAEVIGWLHTGNYALNWAISGRFLRGWPLGHCAEIYGDNSTGKSYLIQQALRNAQAANGVAMLDDTESAFNPKMAERTLGINTASLAYRRSHLINEHIDTVIAFATAIEDLKLFTPCVLACDSLANLMTDSEADNPHERDMKRQQDIKRLFRVTGNKLSSLPISYLVANHKISLMGQVWGKQSDSSGGGGPKYQASIRLDLRTPSRIKDSAGNFTGVIVTAFVEKNRISTPWRTVKLAIPFYRQIHDASGLLPVLLQLNVIQLNGNEIILRGESTGLKFLKTKGSFLLNDDAAGKLLEKYPTLLAEVDAWLDENPAVYTVNTETGEVDE